MRTRLVLFVLVPLLTLGGGCGDDSTTSGGPPDTTPPGVSNVAAVDANHLTVTFSEAVKKTTAETPQNYSIVEGTPAARSAMDTAAPGDTTHVGTAILDSDQKTVTITTQEAMGVLPYDMTVMGVQDLAGNVIETPVTTSFTGSDASDTTPPQVVLQSPAPGATGVAIGTSVTVQFNEPMNGGSVQAAFQWTNSGSVPWQMQEEADNTFVFAPQQTLEYNTVYTINVSTGAQDVAGNGLASTVMWTFRTTASPDNTPPTLVSSTPTNGATNVPVTTNLVLTFSEPIDTMLSLENVFLSPDVGEGDVTWSVDLTRITFDPYVDLLDNTTYSLTIPPGDLRDAAGNGNTSAIQIVWSTGNTLASGRFSGVVSGDPGTPAANPAGALVVAADSNPFGPGGDNFGVGGTGVVGSNGAYSIMNLADDWYYPLSVLDSNGDGEIDPSYGDAIGAYGVVLGVDMEPDSVHIVGGNSVTGINFSLFDPMVIVGYLTYNGIKVTVGDYYIGVFRTAGFDPQNIPDPDYGTMGFWPPFDYEYKVDEFEDGLAPGTYYVGAYLDFDLNGMYDPGVDPAGFYGGIQSLIPITLGAGEDAFNINITIEDPAAASSAGGSVSWSSTQAPSQTRDVARRIREVLEKAR